MKLRVFEAFSGVGSQRMALRNLGIDHEVVAIAEIDVDAIISYGAIHTTGDINIPSEEEMINELTEKNIGYDFKKDRIILPKGDRLTTLYRADKLSKNIGDVSLLSTDVIPDHDLFTYSFPCQDISVAGRQDGFSEGSGTRSSLLWECVRVIENKKPKYLLLENVKNIVGKKNKADFEKWLEWLNNHGYRNYWQVVNAKDCLIPQNRERVFVVSILADEGYEFPTKQELKLRLKDILETTVDEKYYLSEELQKRFVYKENVREIKKVGNIRKNGYSQSGNVFEINGISPTLCSGELLRDPLKILIKNATKRGFLEAVDGDGIDLNYPDSATRRGRVQPHTTSGDYGVLEFPVIGASRGRNPYNPSDRTVGAPTEQRLEINKKGVSNTLTSVQKDNYVIEQGFRIRKLTPLECWRLMGFTDEDFAKAKASGVSDSQLYKQAGNSIVVPVLEGIFRNLFLKEDK